ncbi:hypothetical protein [uncultured Piscinibacter sp.]|uniref:hypothetical protein n=1 Tax=uncultured Piscinibacter sp. TaxID=1131835 RepID=UPI0026169FE6|nr:hypothetical protein [uncultured Piscinibacter sp.]
MNGSSDQFATELLQRVDEVLYYLWDPLGVAREPSSRQEYSAFASEVFAALVDDADEQRLMELLLLLETDFLGLGPRPSQARRVAELLFDWRVLLEQKYAGGSSY